MSEIVETLKRLQCSDAACGDMRIAMAAKLAIYEIERLRTELCTAWEQAERWRDERDDAKAEVARLLDVETGHRIAIAGLTAERDEARRECCTWQGLESGKRKQDVAISRGWNCLRWPDPDALDRIAKLDEEVGIQ